MASLPVRMSFSYFPFTKSVGTVSTPRFLSVAVYSLTSTGVISSLCLIDLFLDLRAVPAFRAVKQYHFLIGKQRRAPGREDEPDKTQDRREGSEAGRRLFPARHSRRRPRKTKIAHTLKQSKQTSWSQNTW